MPKIIKSPRIIRKVKLFDEVEVEEIDPEELEAQKRKEEEEKRIQEISDNIKQEMEKNFEEQLVTQRLELLEKFQEEKKQTYQEGYKAGEKEGIKIGQEEVIPIKEKLDQIINSLSKEKEKILADAEETIAKLSYEMAKRIIYGELRTDPSIIVRVVKEALQFVINNSKVILRVHTDDLKVIKEHEKELVTSVTDIEDVEIVGDDRIQQGGCLIETNAGDIDARLETKLEELSKVVFSGGGGE